MADNADNTQELQDLSEILKVRRTKLQELQQNGRDPFKIIKYEVTNSATEIIDSFEVFEDKQVSLAGRLMSRRGMGKASFCDLQDRDGKNTALCKDR